MNRIERKLVNLKIGQRRRILRQMYGNNPRLLKLKLWLENKRA